jgi:hypothetical protein
VAYDFEAPFNRVKAIVAAISGMQAVHEGVPESLSHARGAYLTFSEAERMPKVTGMEQVEQRYTVVFAPRVRQAEGTAERWIMQSVAALADEVNDDRKLGGAAHDAWLDRALAGTAEYQQFAGVEYRLYPVQVVTVLRDTYPTQQ